MPLHRSRRALRGGAGPDRRGPGHAPRRRHRRGAVERAGDGARVRARPRGGHPGHHLGLRPTARGSPPARHLHRHREPQARRRAWRACCSDWRPAAARSASSPEVPRRRTSTSACRGSATRCRGASRRRRPEIASKAPEDGPRSPAARSTPTTTSCSPSSRWTTCFARFPDLTAFVATGGWPQFVDQAYRQVARAPPRADRVQAHDRDRGRHPADADGAPARRPEPRPGRPAAARDGLPRDGGPARPRRRRQGRGPDLYWTRRLHRGERRDLRRVGDRRHEGTLR